MRAIAIIGGGPAGALAAERLARGDRRLRVLLFEERLGWEKPCGGGLTYKTLKRYPFLRDAAEPHCLIRDTEFISANGERLSLRLSNPVAVYSRRVLNSLLIERAHAAGAELVTDRVVDFRRNAQGWEVQARHSRHACDHLVLAAGARTPLRARLADPFKADDLVLTFGYYLPAAETLLRVQFLRDCEGYAWAFPRPDHLSVGVAAKMGELSMADLKRRLHAFMRDFGYGEPRQSPVFSHVLPGLGRESWKRLALSGAGWSIVGDAAGLVDPITGEGIYYALRSGDLVAQSILEGDPRRYAARVRREFAGKLAYGSRLVRRFYAGTFLGQPVTSRMIQYARKSQAFRRLLEDLIDGTQSYPSLALRVCWALVTSVGDLAFGDRGGPPGMQDQHCGIENW